MNPFPAKIRHYDVSISSEKCMKYNVELNKTYKQ